MRPELQKEFGHCLIPKGTLLYHGAKDCEIGNCMFFGLDFWLASVFHKRIYVWKTQTPIEVVFLCESLDWRGGAESGIPRLYKQVFPEERNSNLSDLDIKHFDHNRRNKFTAELYALFDLNGWLASMEGNTELEVCLLDAEFIRQNLKLIDVKGAGDMTYFKNSLRDVEVYPPPVFFEKTYKRLHGYYGTSINRTLYRERHEKWVESLIQESSQSENDVLRNIEHHFDLRTKLHI